MLVVWIVLSLIVGFVCGHLFWTRTKVEEVIKEVPVEKIVKEEVPIKPVDYDEYLEWKEHKENWIDLANFVAIIKAIERELNGTYDGELSRTPRKKKKTKNI